jgi:hypothetical protein
VNHLNSLEKSMSMPMLMDHNRLLRRFWRDQSAWNALGLDSFDARSLSEVKMELYTDVFRALKFGKVEDEPHSQI